jgi:hypothetical protein
MSKFVRTLGVVIVITAFARPAYAQSTTADLAKSCREQTIKAHPTPVAGSKNKGVNEAQRAFFQTCVSRGADNKQQQQQKN